MMAVIKRNDDDGMYDDCAQISRVSARLKNLELTVVIFKLFFFLFLLTAPPKDWGVKIISKPSASDFVNVTCWANGAFPEPKLTIYYGADRGERA